MKKIFFYLLPVVMLIACVESTKITGAWKNPKQPVKSYSSIFVASLTSNTVARATIENNLSAALEKEGIAVYRSMDEFPPGIKKDSLTKDEIMRRMKNKKSDAILTVSLIRSETESQYFPDGGYPYAPFPRYGWYGDFWGYYSYWYPSFYSPGYYVQDKIYYMESNLYDAATEQVVWSAQSRTYNPSDVENFSKEFSRVIVSKLKEDGMLKTSAPNLSLKK